MAPGKPATNNGLTGVRKRQQIENTNKHIFIWVAVSSVIISFCLIALQFLVKEFLFNQRVITAKSQTNKQLIDNVIAAKQLKSNVDALIADTNLAAAQSQNTDPAAKTSTLNVILDALPVDGDATSFANSLQTVVLARSGVNIRQLNTTLDQSTVVNGTAAPAVSSNQPLSLPFEAGFSGNYGEVQKALVDMSRVIRPINLNGLSIRSDDESKLQVIAKGVTYYLPARVIDVNTKVLKP